MDIDPKIASFFCYLRIITFKTNKTVKNCTQNINPIGNTNLYTLSGVYKK